MIGGKPKGNICLGVFVPSTFYDRQKLFEVLDSRVEEISQVVTITTGPKIVEEWADLRGKTKVVINLSSMSLPSAAKAFSELSSNVCLFDNGNSKALDKILDVLQSEEGKKYKIIKVKDCFPRSAILKKILATKDSDEPILTPKEYEVIEEMING